MRNSSKPKPEPLRTRIHLVDDQPLDVVSMQVQLAGGWVRAWDPERDCEIAIPPWRVKMLEALDKAFDRGHL